MRYYAYFPGCSLEGTAIPYKLSIQAVSQVLEIELIELEDWNCCGASAYSSVDELASTCISARNLALAERTGLDLVTACSACYTTLNKANSSLKQYPQLKAQVDEVLAVVGLEYRGTARIRHLAQVLLEDIGCQAIASKVRQPLQELRVAPYYGCQLVRPYPGTNGTEFPDSLDRLMQCLGAEVTDFPLKTRCCGGSLIISQPEVALDLIRKLLDNAVHNGAQCLVTVCPLCQTNLDAYQGKAAARSRAHYRVPVLFFTQLVGLALGMNFRELGIDKLVVPAERLLAQYKVKV